MGATKLRSIKTQLSLATCGLLQAVAPAAHAESDWRIDSALMIYSESDGRVSALEPVVNAAKEIGQDETINLKLVLDALTGATPNGANPSSSPQTFTTPSGDSSYTVAPSDDPLDDTFHDSRVAISAEWELPVFDQYSRMILGGNVSKEFDYMSLGASVSLLRDFNQRNTTASIALGVNADTITPVGGTPIPLVNMRINDNASKDGSSDTKSITDVMLGITQVIDRKTLMQFNLGFSSTSGYQNDPYKIVTIVDDLSGLPIADTATDRPYVYESRPDSRSRQTFFWKTVHHLTEDTINFSYRYYTDDWDVNSHTLDLHYRYELGGNSYLEPHVRYYTQTAAEFFTHGLTASELAAIQATDGYASADYRLGEFTTTTLGLKYATPIGKTSEFSVRGEIITQANNDVAVPAGYESTGLDLSPDLTAIVLQVGYSFNF
jgi:Protein of unknown function (DUF3570)